MNKYLRAVGFSKYTKRKDTEELLKDFVYKPENVKEMYSENQETVVEIFRPCGRDIGIVLRGTGSGNNSMDMEYYFPCTISNYSILQRDLCVEKRISADAYLGACEDVRVGVSMIFFVQNAIDVDRILEKNGGLPPYTVVMLSALSLSGNILLPVLKTSEDMKKKKDSMNRRARLISAARQGDEQAMEALTFEDMEIYSKISKKIVNEDVFTLVESSFMPYGMEPDQYMIVADILSVEQTENLITGEKVWLLALSYNDVYINLAINAMDLQGEPAVGRRFKGVIWLQGRIILPADYART